MSRKQQSSGRGGERKLQRVAHDMNNVFAAILGTADLMTLRLKSGETSKEDVDEIRKAAERGVRLTSQLAKYARQRTRKARRH